MASIYKTTRAVQPMYILLQNWKRLYSCSCCSLYDSFCEEWDGSGWLSYFSLSSCFFLCSRKSWDSFTLLSLLFSSNILLFNIIYCWVNNWMPIIFFNIACSYIYLNYLLDSISLAFYKILIFYTFSFLILYFLQQRELSTFVKTILNNLN